MMCISVLKTNSETIENESNSVFLYIQEIKKMIKKKKFCVSLCSRNTREIKFCICTEEMTLFYIRKSAWWPLGQNGVRTSWTFLSGRSKFSSPCFCFLLFLFLFFKLPSLLYLNYSIFI